LRAAWKCKAPFTKNILDTNSLNLKREPRVLGCVGGWKASVKRISGKRNLAEIFLRSLRNKIV
jgi:hypothetical protein